MARRISLALVMHNHQPVGNFGWVIEEVFGQAYEPMVAALERHPQVRVGLHYTGPLLEWIVANRPEFIDSLRALDERGQVELLGGGYFEPVLASLPERDRQGQLARMRDELERLFGTAPVGAWLAERVWEPALAADLAQAGYRYTVLDDNHLRGATVPEDEMWGTYTTDDQGRMLTVFGTEKGLRYRIPWKPVPDLIEYLREHATEDGRLLGTMGDDGEKFGAWPGTYELSWGANGEGG
jgi:4-alpha-glucanotransferase